MDFRNELFPFVPGEMGGREAWEVLKDVIEAMEVSYALVSPLVLVPSSASVRACPIYAK